MTRCFRCLDDGTIDQGDGVLICDCAAGRAHVAAKESLARTAERDRVIRRLVEDGIKPR